MQCFFHIREFYLKARNFLEVTIKNNNFSNLLIKFNRILILKMFICLHVIQRLFADTFANFKSGIKSFYSFPSLLVLKSTTRLIFPSIFLMFK